MLRAMETREVLRHRVQREEPLKAPLRLATTRLAGAEQERMWARWWSSTYVQLPRRTTQKPYHGDDAEYFRQTRGTKA
jgi:hypothetical protein